MNFFLLLRKRLLNTFCVVQNEKNVFLKHYFNLQDKALKLYHLGQK